MTNRTRTFGAALVLAFAVALTPVEAQAQAFEQPVTVDVRGGMAVPLGDLGDLADVGPSLGAGVAYRVHPRVSVRGDLQVDVYSGADFDASSARQPSAPDMSLWHYSAGVEFDVTQPGTSRWHVTADVGGGATTIDTDAFDEPITNPETDEIEADFNATYATVHGGMTLGYDVHERVDVYGAARWYLTFTDEEETAVFDQLSPTTSAFDQASSVPITVGVRVKL